MDVLFFRSTAASGKHKLFTVYSIVSNVHLVASSVLKNHTADRLCSDVWLKNKERERKKHTTPNVWPKLGPRLNFFFIPLLALTDPKCLSLIYQKFTSSTFSSDHTKPTQHLATVTWATSGSYDTSQNPGLALFVNFAAIYAECNLDYAQIYQLGQSGQKV